MIIMTLKMCIRDSLIPFKAKAWCELTDRKLSKERGLTKHIKKYLRDIMILARLIVVNREVKWKGKVVKDMEWFIKDVQFMNSDNQLIKDIYDDLSIYYLLEIVII